MGFRFWRRVRLAPGVTLNLSKLGGSLSFGPRGAKFTVGSRGRRVTAGIPGTGLFYTASTGGGREAGRASTGRAASGARSDPSPAWPDPSPALRLGFFKRLVTPEAERCFVDGCRELNRGAVEAALGHLRKAVGLADGAFMRRSSTLPQPPGARQSWEPVFANTASPPG